MVDNINQSTSDDMIDTNIGETLHRLLHAYKRAMRQAYQDEGLHLTISHIRSLKVIGHHRDHLTEACTSRLIANRLERDKAQIARVIKELLTEHLIEKSNNPDDRRSQILHLTDKGVATINRIKQAERLAGSRMAQGLSPDEIAEFTRLATTMTENLIP